MEDQLQTGSRKRQKTEGWSVKQRRSDPLRTAKFERGQHPSTRSLTDRKLKAQLQYGNRLATEATTQAAKADEWLLPAEAGTIEVEGMERTYQFSQAALASLAEVGAARKVFDLDLPQLGPYSLDFTRNGTFMVLGGRKGHLALTQWQQAQSFAELQVKETVRDVVMLHNESFFAAAQKKHVYIYDKHGLEVHCLREHINPRRLDFLPYHFLLVTTGHSGSLLYQDTTTGQIVAAHKMRQGPCSVLGHNPWNAISLTGHPNGTVQMWSPNMPQALVKMLCHQGPLHALAVDMTGHHLVTSGNDCQVKVWDVRMFRALHAFRAAAPVTSLAVSQRGLLATGQGRRVQVYKEALSHAVKAPYLTRMLHQGAVQKLRFCPYEDILGVGHAGGVSTLLVPGAGEPNYDSRVANPLQGRRARREQEVHRLLDKLQPSMIVLDPASIGQVRREPEEARQEKLAAAAQANAQARTAQRAKNDKKTPMKGKNKPSRRHRKKQENVIEEKQGTRRQQQTPQVHQVPIPDSASRLLHGFYRSRH